MAQGALNCTIPLAIIASIGPLGRGTRQIGWIIRAGVEFTDVYLVDVIRIALAINAVDVPSVWIDDESGDVPDQKSSNWLGQGRR